jgi:hypothetical protein
MLVSDAASDADRSCLMRMRRAWLALADNEDWLDGKCINRTMTRSDITWPAEPARLTNPI